MWTRVGVQTTIEAIPWSTYSVRGARREFSAGLGGWGSNTAEAGYLLINIIGTYDPAAGRGAANQRRYSNPALDTLTDRALSTFDPAERERLLIQAVEMASNDVAIIPLHQLINYWATKKSIAYTPRMDERTVAMNAKPAR
jgi:peptide/nickel transport system substrate-binding protein